MKGKEVRMAEELSPKEKLIIAELGEKGLEEFKRFRSKELQRETRQELNLKTKELLETTLQQENWEAIEALNKVYRKAWTMSCKELDCDEAEFPSKY